MTVSSAEEFRDRVVLIDTGLDSMNHIELCRDGHKDFTGTGLHDSLDHGTEVFRVATKGMNVGKYCITIVKWTDAVHYPASDSYLVRVMNYVYSLHPKFVNVSSSGTRNAPREQTVMQNMVSGDDTKFFVSAGNDSKDLSNDCSIYPACYNLTNGLIVVGSENEQGIRLPSSNYGGPVNASALGVYHYNGKTYQGTSFASPAVLSRELR